MKLFAFIFAILTVSLAIQPTAQLLIGSETNEEICSDNCCEPDNNCPLNADSQKKDLSDCCPGGICNPFQACACCCGGIVGKPSLSLATFFLKVNHDQLNLDNPVLGFSPECYQPPEVG